MAATLQLLTEKDAGKTRAREGASPPASGGGAGAADLIPLAKKLADLLTADDLAGAVKVWREGLTATKKVWSAKKQKYVNGGPDWQIRRDMAEAIAAYMEGRPMERQLSISGSFEELGDLLQTLRNSGEAARLMPFVNALPSTTKPRE